MAQAARVFRLVDDDFADRCLGRRGKELRVSASTFRQTIARPFRIFNRRLSAPTRRSAVGGGRTVGNHGRRQVSARLRNTPIAMFQSRRSTLVTWSTTWDWGNVRNLGSLPMLVERPGRDDVARGKRSRRCVVDVGRRDRRHGAPPSVRPTAWVQVLLGMQRHGRAANDESCTWPTRC